MFKGGVWKKTEDEILKAAVIKYGKNQCKARWYEWLDPSIKETEWTRQEEEKLLHRAKAHAYTMEDHFPDCWSYSITMPAAIDPNPESNPARPDPVDMDEDEKEMLSLARARLANTRGKKAKRKAREKQLEEARRLDSLQKGRELWLLALILGREKRNGIDFNVEIPFKKKPPPGFYDVADEDIPVEQLDFHTTIEELKGKRRNDLEAQLRKQDIAKNKIAQTRDAPSAILQANKMNDPETVGKRSKGMLPAPQISDSELEELAKMGYVNDLAVEEFTEGSGATRAILANYSQTPRQGITPSQTPQRTPAGKGDAIMMEAENLAKMRVSGTIIRR